MGLKCICQLWERDMKISTMIALSVLFWVYVAFCLWSMGKFAGAI